MAQLTHGTKLGPYEIIGPLGAGGMGEVYRARDPRLGREVAIKVLPHHLCASAELRARFEREARTLSLVNHPSICTLHDVGRDSGIDYLVMELIDGETLAHRLQQGPLPIDRLLTLAEQITAALTEAHRAGLVHRDLKPANLMLTDSGVKLLDFGLARPAQPAEGAATADSQAPTMHQPLTSTGAIVGTFQYMAPEQLEGREADARTDLFALGCILYEMATGQRPFRGNDSVTILGSILRDRPEAVARLKDSLPRGLQQIIARCLEQDPALRFASAEELRAELSRLRRWPSEVALPELAGICDRILVVEEGRDSWEAFLLAREIDKLTPSDAMLERLRPDFSQPVSIHTHPPGASVFTSYYGDPDGDGLALGTTPLDSIPYPRGLTRLRIMLPGHRTMHDLVWSLTKGLNNAMVPETTIWSYRLVPPGAIPDEMEAVPAGGFPLYMPGFDHLETEPTVAFLIDRHPVTNREFKSFIDAGGYALEELWHGPFLEGETELTWSQAVARFTDTVGRPGPANWEMGDFPSGEGEHPAAGVSWHEAAAYATWAGKTLPTMFHWNRVAFPFATSLISPLANLSGR
ncbi:MAG: protein kinase, partial [Candidatus Eisenbacteria bacterium]